MKRLWGTYLLTFVIVLLLLSILLYCVISVLIEFKLTSVGVINLWSAIVVLVVSIIFVLACIVSSKKLKKSKIINWLSNNIAKLVLTYSLLMLFLLSLRSDIIFDIDEIKEILSVGWTIFGISSSIFLIWHIVVIEYLNNRKPHKPIYDLPIKAWRYIEEKGDFYRDATFLLTNATLLLVNLLGLSTTTVTIYVTYREVSILTQSMTILSLFLCTNSLVGLFLDMLKLFREKKRLLLKETKVTSKDVDFVNEIIVETENVLTAIDIVKKAKNIGEEYKTEVVTALLETYCDRFEKVLSDKSLEKGE